MIHLNNSGTAYEIGLQHGASCPKAVQQAYQAWGQLRKIEAQKIEAGLRLVKKRLERSFPEILEEMQGIADGAGLTLQQVITLNCSAAIIGSGLGGSSCSNIGFRDSDAGILIGKTADWNVAEPQNFAAWQRYQPAAGHQGYAFIHYGCAGTLWTEGGLNEAGLGMVLNGLPGSGSDADSVPTLTLTRGVLQHCRDVQDAVDWLGRYDVMHWGFNLTLGDAGGVLAFVEVVPGAQAVHHPSNDYLIHTNHCLLPGTLERQLSDEDVRVHGYSDLARNSRDRYQTLARLVPPAPRTRSSMERLLRDRSAPGAISQRGEEGMYTVYAMIIAPAQGEIWGAEGYPPDVPFVRYEI